MEYQQLFSYKKWADVRALDSIHLVDGTLHADSLSFVRQQLNHIVIVEELFKSRLLDQQAPHPATNSQFLPELDELKTRLLESCDWYLSYVAGIDSKRAKAMRTISFVFADGLNGSMTISEILFHIVNHGSYHRGSIARALDQAGVPHPADGYGIFIHESEPHRRS